MNGTIPRRKHSVFTVRSGRDAVLSALRLLWSKPAVISALAVGPVPLTAAKTYSITSLASASSVGGRLRPSAFAVFRLITSSYLVGACTGRSAGFSPLRIRST